MKRLTTDAPKNNLESALNLFYAKVRRLEERLNGGNK